MDGFTKQVEEGWFAAFPSNKGTSHTVINDTDEDVVYICIGEAEDFKDEKITYPLNPLRNKECDRKGWFWKEAPQVDKGLHKGKPQQPFEAHLSFRVCNQENVNEVLEIFKNSPSYFEKVDGCLPNEKTAKQAIIDGPKKTGEKYFKEFLIIEYEEKPIGVLDLHANHPETGNSYLGLLLIEESQFGKGLGRKCYELAEDYIQRSLDCNKIRLGVSDENDVSPFWMKMGFEFNGKTYEWKGEEKTANVREFEKILED
jgi:RimJ/RimL family protein N-acetyltransferase